MTSGGCRACIDIREYQGAAIGMAAPVSYTHLDVYKRQPRFAAMAFGRNYLSLGGCISGFFGGLSGHQGAFRSMFLLKAGIGKEQFIATGVVLAVMVDLARMLI